MANYQLSKTGAEIDAALDLAVQHETSKMGIRFIHNIELDITMSNGDYYSLLYCIVNASQNAITTIDNLDYSLETDIWSVANAIFIESDSSRIEYIGHTYIESDNYPMTTGYGVLIQHKDGSTYYIDGVSSRNTDVSSFSIVDTVTSF